MKKITKIAIIGGGFYGSYLAYKLSFLKKFKIELFEKNNEILAETAIKNQYRLHTGFHYPRSEQTINQTIIGYKMFKKEFDKFLYFPKKNIYLIHKNSNVNFLDYKNIFKEAGLQFSEINISKIDQYLNNSKNFTGAINTKEGVILLEKLNYFLKKSLSNKIKINLNTEIIYIDSFKGILESNMHKFSGFDFIINCTYTNTNLGIKKNKFNLKYEITGMIKIKKPFHEQLGITIMDGKFCSLYPQNKTYSTISSVLYTPILKNNSFKVLKKKSKKIDLSIFKKKIIFHAKQYFNLPKKMKFEEIIVGNKVKFRNDHNDERYTEIKFSNKLISVLCGKLDTAQIIYKKIYDYMK